jgi:predicted transposase/invertase (TIGR01784 family)
MVEIFVRGPFLPAFPRNQMRWHLTPRKSGLRTATGGAVGLKIRRTTYDERLYAAACGLHFLEIPKYTKSPKKRISDMTKMERWLAYFANQLSDDEKGELIMSDEAIHKAVDAARTFLQNDAERLAYINRELAILDYNSDHRDAFEEGEAKGRDEGRKEGEERLGMLMSLLLKENRHDDVAKAATDAGFREKLFKEYGI